MMADAATTSTCRLRGIELFGVISGYGQAGDGSPSPAVRRERAVGTPQPRTTER